MNFNCLFNEHKMIIIYFFTFVKVSCRCEENHVNWGLGGRRGLNRVFLYTVTAIFSRTISPMISLGVVWSASALIRSQSAEKSSTAIMRTG